MRHGSNGVAAAAAIATVLILAAGIAAGQELGAPASAPAAVTSSDYPDSTVFVMMRTLADPVAGVGQAELRDRLRQWQGMAHDHAIRVDNRWLSTEEITTHCQAFIKQQAELAQILSQAAQLDRQQNPVRVYGPGVPRQTVLQRQQQDQQARMEHDRLMQQARDKIVATARLWPDPVIRHFLQGQAALATGNGRQAEDLFKQCIDVMPTVAAFHQGRAMARAAQKRELDALDDRIAVFNLDPSNAQSFQALHDAFAAAPGNRMVAPAFARAAALLDQFEGPGGPRPQPPARPQRNQPAAPIEWPMPGTVWRSDAQSLTVPDCRSVIARKTVAVPIAADEVMCDQAAIADAAVILLEVAKGQYLKLTPVAVHPADKAADELPLAVLRAEQCQFRPVELADVTTLKVGQELKGQADSLPAELDPAGPRKFTLRVRAIEDNLPAFSGGLRPGESASPVFNADNRLVTFLASRADVMADLGGPERALAPVQVGELVTAAVKGSHASGPSHAAVTRKAGPWKVEDPVLTLHVVVMQGKP